MVQGQQFFAQQQVKVAVCKWRCICDVMQHPDWFLDSTQRPVVAVGVHFFNEDYIADIKVRLGAAPFTSGLERMKIFTSPTYPELVRKILNSTPASA